MELIKLKIADLIELLTTIDPDKIVLGRYDYTDEFFRDDLAIVDSLSFRPLGTAVRYNDELEQEEVETLYQSSFTVDFYGDNSFMYASQFQSKLSKSQRSIEFQRDNRFTCYAVTDLRDLKNPKGEVTYQRYQIEFKVKFTETNVETDILDIQSVQYQIEKED